MNKYVIITGGELLNKGAQAMTFTTVNEIAKRFPQYETVLISGPDYRRSEDEKSNYKFKIIPAPSDRIKILSGFTSSPLLLRKLYKSEADKIFIDVVRKAVCFIDISGYALGTNWPNSRMEVFCQYIRIAKHLGIPSYIMPQSFGPFDFENGDKNRLRTYIKKSLKYCSVIMAREDEGRILLEENFGLKNIVRTPDLVLQSKGIELNNIYHKVPCFDDVEIRENSVAIIPNMKNNKFGNADDIYSFYKKLIDRLLDGEKTVYFVYHAIEDLEICKIIKDMYYKDNDDVVIIEKELSCIEFGRVVKKFDFVIASRYHSLVHAYKEGIPSIILGWAVKYKELAALFKQDMYCFDVKNNLSGDEILDVADRMLSRYKEESEIIKSGLKEIQTNNVYDYIKL